MNIFLNIAIAYLVGSLNGAILVSKFLDLSDPRTAGSNNPGATNMMRLHGKMAALSAFSIDCTKALVMCLLMPKDQMFYICIAICLGHIFPIYYNFKGGKGVAVIAGLIIGSSIQLAILAITSWVLIFRCSKISSLSALLTIFVCALSYFIPLATHDDYLNLLIPGIIVILSHHSNIKRLIAGTEVPPVT